MFFNLFNRNKLKKPVDISVLKTDMHSHLIPGIDDGVKTLEESMVLIKKLHELGFSKIITTPHIMHDYYKNNITNITEGLNKVKEAVAKENIPIKIEAAAEYLIDDGFEKQVKEGLMTLKDKYILVELSYYNMYHGFFNLVFNLNIDGYKIVLAHPERYSYFHNKFDLYEDLKSRGVFFQLNTISLSGYYSPKVRETAEKLIELGFYDFAGSDMHNMDYMNNFVKALYNPKLQTLIDSGKLKNNIL